jgi:hypothetical protein
VGDSRRRCTITRVKPSGDKFAVLLTCLRSKRSIWSTVSLSLWLADENTMVKTFSDFPEEALRLHRCKI